MHKFKLSNGLTVIYDYRPTDSVTIQFCVKTGSKNETMKTLGVSHFLEHLLFEGTKRRANSEVISKEIEKFGGEFNAYTSEDRTCFYVRILNKHFELALDVLSDMIQHATLKSKKIEQERKIILEEINMSKDEPRQYQWTLFKQTLLLDHPSKSPVIGTPQSVRSITRKDIVDYYNSRYVANNIILSIVGNAGNLSFVKTKVHKYLKSVRQKEIIPQSFPKEFGQSKITVEKRKINSTYLVLGYVTVPRNHKDSYTLDIIKAILGGGQSSWLFQELRSRAKLGYDVGAYHDSEPTLGFFAIYLVTRKQDASKAKSLILKQLKRLQTVKKKHLTDATNYLEGTIKIQTENTQIRADNLCFWEQVSKAQDSTNYFKQLKKVTVNDIKQAARKYFTKKYTIAVIESI